MEIPGANADVNELLDQDEDERKQLADELKEKVRSEIKDVGPLRKEMTVTVPDEIIHHRIDHDFDELRSDIVLPGFRKGRAPLPLIQKRFGTAVRDSLKTTILGQSFFVAIQNQKIEILGDPLFKIDTGKGLKLVELGEAIQHLKLPESGDFTYICEIETKPTFELPKLEGIEIKAPQIEFTDEQVRAEIERQRKVRGRYEPISDGPAEADDLLVADVVLSANNETVKTESNLQLGVRPTRLDGVALENLHEVLSGVRPGERRSVECVIPEDYERPDLRGKPARFEFTIHEVKRLAPISLQTFMDQVGIESEAELLKLARQQMELERDWLVRRAEKEQVLEYLLKNTVLELPEKLSARMTDRAVMRRVIELQQQGAPQEDIEAKIDELRVSAREQVLRDLKLEFIMERVAAKLKVYVTDEEVNTEIARIARLYNRRFDRVRDDLRNRGLLSQLVEHIRQEKCIAMLLEDAKVIKIDGPQS